MGECMWNDQRHFWVDLWLQHDLASSTVALESATTKTPTTKDPKNVIKSNKMSVANWMMLWPLSRYAGFLRADPQMIEQSIDSLQTSGLLLEGGAATTNVKSSQQWDFPNAWPPLQEILIS